MNVCAILIYFLNIFKLFIKALYRPGEGKYLPENIDENLCTHIVYGFAVLDGSTLTIKTHDSWADIDNNFYERVTAYRKKGIKVLVAIGGWNDSLGDKYRLVFKINKDNVYFTYILLFSQKLLIQSSCFE